MSAQIGSIGVPEHLTVHAIAKMIDHSLLRPELTTADVRAGCVLAAGHRVASVCVRPRDVTAAARELGSSEVEVGTVVGFPHGSSTTEIKVAETRLAVAHGATEIDMVIDIGALREGDLDAVQDGIRAVVDAASGMLVKVILENAYLTDEQKVAGCRAAEAAGAAFVKTSTGYAPSGATREDVVLMRSAVSSSVGVKAAGGVRTLDTLLDLVAAGATRFGATATATILADATHRTDS